MYPDTTQQSEPGDGRVVNSNPASAAFTSRHNQRPKQSEPGDGRVEAHAQQRLRPPNIAQLRLTGGVIHDVQDFEADVLLDRKAARQRNLVPADPAFARLLPPP